ncbi:hypothetical protein BESB_082520 [Besnoitia besnoiti]|uniref:Uncharacterized protein n=1 Tax=Besnoitia besnoiti TaxID=94643 RepID=A0A2A9MBJ6_BESBE|nr:hypothetical protein BESB_082520 [Besnoitia besnoiti]PFH33053.1 hypothetical protein BESB_082520 [Besnoitia besnoiti]
MNDGRSCSGETRRETGAGNRKGTQHWKGRQWRPRMKISCRSCRSRPQKGSEEDQGGRRNRARKWRRGRRRVRAAAALRTAPSLKARMKTLLRMRRDKEQMERTRVAFLRCKLFKARSWTRSPVGDAEPSSLQPFIELSRLPLSRTKATEADEPRRETELAGLRNLKRSQLAHVSLRAL